MINRKLAKSYKELKSDTRYLGINNAGNKKLKNTDKVRFIIWNLPAKITCPYATEACKANCYACKAERQYPDVLPSRQRNFEAARRDDFADNMIFTLEAELSTKKYNDKLTIVRIHESGDFFNKAYVAAWLRVMDHFKDNKNIIFQAYTKSLPFFADVELPENFAFISSIWCDTSEEMTEETERRNYRTYIAVDHFTDKNSCETMEEALETGRAFRCRCKDCANCRACMNNNIGVIACEIH